jgi:hypothetical protein
MQCESESDTPPRSAVTAANLKSRTRRSGSLHLIETNAHAGGGQDGKHGPCFKNRGGETAKLASLIEAFST